ncbi:DUF4142 domain-containing protein [Pseudomonas aeruginosa]|nr:DUF4142 domain-containing protein [Pseudomonas aeruginosa]MDQ4369309.1 DUF4142 domain-containing protein [Pseudomonas aeruginosa]
MDAHRLSIAAIVDQHAEEAAFLALLRDYAVRAPHYDLEELAELDQRIEAHLDGLAIAGQAGHDALLEQLDAQIRQQDRLVARFEGIARDSADPDLRRFADEWLARFYHHRELADQLRSGRAD